MHDVEPFDGWQLYYDANMDDRSPFRDADHQFHATTRQIYNYVANPLWEPIGSESLLVKILFADYDRGYGIIELIGEWNDLHQNDFKLLVEECLAIMQYEGINKFIFICENVFNIYVNDEDYYEAFTDELQDGWVCLLRARDHVKEDFQSYGLDQYLFWSPQIDEIMWRKLRPWQLFEAAENVINRPLIGDGDLA